MNKILVYERNIVQCKVKIKDENDNIMFNTNDLIFITKIDTIQGLKVFINTGEIISRPKISNYVKWLKRHFKLTI
jgi:hypothetical protein